MAIQTRQPWHHSAVLDIAGSHFSWIWVFIPLWYLRENAAGFYAILFAIEITNFLHRHFSLPYAYLNPDVRYRFRSRLVFFPGAMVLLFILSPIWTGSEALPRSGPLPGFIQAAACTAVVWNFWHTLMQKFGLLRLYARTEGDRSVPKWVDRFFVLGWVPLFVLALPVRHEALLMRLGYFIGDGLAPLIQFSKAWVRPLALPAIGFLVLSWVVFVLYEAIRHRFRNVPRFSMALGFQLVSATMIFIDPFIGFMSFAFSHAVEYIFFVVVTEKNRGAKPLARYGAFSAGLAAVFGFTFIFRQQSVAGASVDAWLLYWVIYSSLVHFFLDGFLWKRGPRESLVRSS